MSYEAPAPVLIAASKAIDKLLGKIAIEPGLHSIDHAFTFRLNGTLQKDSEQRIAAKPEIPWPLVLTLLCKRLKLPRAEARRLIGDCTKAAIGFGDNLPEIAGFGDRFSDAVAAVDEARDGSPKIDKGRAGATKWLGTLQIEAAE